jgi:adenosylcobinamide-GDP ribazoletransferase
MPPLTAIVGLAAGHALARAGSIGLMTRMPPAQGSTLGASYKDQSTNRGALAGIVFALTLSFATLGGWTFGSSAVVFVALLISGLLAQQKIGGFNGDVLGATEQLAEIGILLLIASAPGGIPWWRA